MNVNSSNGEEDAGMRVLARTHPRAAAVVAERELKGCDFSGYTLVAGAAARTVSPTDLYIVEKDGSLFFVKAFVIATSENEFLLLHEITYYLLTTLLYEKKVVRNVVPLVQYSKECTLAKFQELAGPAYADNVARNMDMIVNRPPGNFQAEKPRPSVINDGDPFDIVEVLKRLRGKRYGFIMTRAVLPVSDRLDSATFIEFMSKQTYTPSEFIQYYAQLLYTVIVFAGNEFNHNDLHMENIMVDEYLPGEHPYCKYECRNVSVSSKPIVFYTNTPYIPRVYDYDRSTWSNAPNEGLVDDFMNNVSGQMKTFMHKTDILKLSCSVFSELQILQNAAAARGNIASAERIRKLSSAIVKLTLPSIASVLDFEQLPAKHGTGCFYNNNTATASGLKNAQFLDKWVDDVPNILQNIARMLARIVGPPGPRDECSVLVYDANDTRRATAPVTPPSSPPQLLRGGRPPPRQKRSPIESQSRTRLRFDSPSPPPLP